MKFGRVFLRSNKLFRKRLIILEKSYETFFNTEDKTEAYIENMSTEDKVAATNIFRDLLENDETEHKNFNDWLFDYVHDGIYESGLEG